MVTFWGKDAHVQTIRDRRSRDYKFVICGGYVLADNHAYRMYFASAKRHGGWVTDYKRAKMFDTVSMAEHFLNNDGRLPTYAELKAKKVRGW